MKKEKTIRELKEKLMTRKAELEKKNKKFFKKIEEKELKRMYHTKIYSMINNFKARPNKGKFWLCFRNVFDPSQYESLHLFHVKEGDRFMGIYYGFTKLPKPFIINYNENGEKKTNRIKKGFYIEFRFKKGSVFCYLRSLYTLLRIKNKGKNFYSSLLSRTLNLEKEVYQFYGKKYNKDKGILKWIEKNQK
ncbi:DUF226 domain-containing protein (plasmid) [Borrelia sp. A-FGy1]|uniref:DUF226 domain-containing protein n=1 Tax=Borrelia sp. A-FGy1 TaxID=2608247 RepID=UPI0017742EE1|nr:DUF226 domain-containing protein [Borrelia sp. A-FGy1]QMU99743.1 DUF226 domain-containing protein [Borrelia sp. A-FGy1]